MTLTSCSTACMVLWYAAGKIHLSTFYMKIHTVH